MVGLRGSEQILVLLERAGAGARPARGINLCKLGAGAEQLCPAPGISIRSDQGGHCGTAHITAWRARNLCYSPQSGQVTPRIFLVDFLLARMGGAVMR